MESPSETIESEPHLGMAPNWPQSQGVDLDLLIQPGVRLLLSPPAASSGQSVAVEVEAAVSDGCQVRLIDRHVVPPDEGMRARAWCHTTGSGVWTVEADVRCREGDLFHLAYQTAWECLRRRRHPRLHVSVPVRWVAPGSLGDGQLLDVSIGGMRLLSAGSGLRRGGSLIVDIEMGDRHISVPASVVDLRDQPDGRQMVHMAISCSEQSAAPLIDELISGASSGRIFAGRLASA